MVNLCRMFKVELVQRENIIKNVVKFKPKIDASEQNVEEYGCFVVCGLLNQRSRAAEIGFVHEGVSVA
jgi:hypothetical protein